jgi:hypothetical protein
MMTNNVPLEIHYKYTYSSSAKRFYMLTITKMVSPGSFDVTDYPTIRIAGFLDFVHGPEF